MQLVKRNLSVHVYVEEGGDRTHLQLLQRRHMTAGV